MVQEGGGASGDAAIDFRKLFETAPGCFLVLSPGLRIIAVSDAYLAATNTRRGEITGRGLFEVFPDNPGDPGADGVRNLRASLERVLRSRQADRMARQRYDIPRPAAAGGGFEERHWDPLNTPVLDEAGNLVSIIHQVTDVTALAALTDERQHLRTIVDSSGEACISQNTAGVIIDWNPAAADLLACPRDAALQRPFEDFIAPESLAEDRALRERVRLAGRGEYLEVLLRTRDGRTLTGAGILAPITDQTGTVVGFIRTVHDISRRRQADQELDRIFALSLDMLCISSADGYFKRVSPALTRILGWSVEEFLARPYLESIHPDDIAATRAAVEQQVLRGEPVFQFENRYRHKDGSWRLLSWASVPQDGGRMYAVARDVTSQRQSEADIVRLNAELRRSAERLEANNRELEAFSYSVSHDLRAPLRSIDGFSRALEDDHAEVLGDEGRRLLAIIRRNAVRMGRLIDDLLDFSRVTRHDLQMGACDMTAMARTAFEELDEAARAHVMQVDLPPLPPATGDAGMLAQVWANLIGNAVKFTRRRDGAEIRISAETAAGEVVYRVADNGAGFDQQYADKLFGVFQRLHSQEEFEGTGIGLSLVQRIVQRHGGRIWAEGRPGAGATFSFALPIAVPATSNA